MDAVHFCFWPRHCTEGTGALLLICLISPTQKGYHSVDSGARYHFIIGHVIDLHDKTVQTNITIGHHYQALAPPHQYALDALGFQQGKGPVFSREVVTFHSQLAAHVIDTLLILQKAMSVKKLIPTW